jgi:hypothetical protein
MTNEELCKELESIRPYSIDSAQAAAITEACRRLRAYSQGPLSEKFEAPSDFIPISGNPRNGGPK